MEMVQNHFQTYDHSEQQYYKIAAIYANDGHWCRNGGQLPPLPFYQEGQRGHYCPFHSSTIVTKQMPANLKAGLSNVEEI